jgi:hypothetical protein
MRVVASHIHPHPRPSPASFALTPLSRKRAQVLALRVLAERLEHGEARPVEISIALPAVT